MRKFTVECKDDKTGLSMVLSECSYNMAMDWLVHTLEKYDVDIYRCEYDINRKMQVIFTGKFSHILGDFKPCRRYYYDEERGYLLGE